MTTTPRMALICLIGLGLACSARGQEAAPATDPAGDDAADPLLLSSTQPPADPWTSPDIAAPLMDEPVVRRPQARRSAGGSAAPSRSFLPWVRTSASLAGVVALIFLLAWGYRLGTGAGTGKRFSLLSRCSGPIQVIGRTNLAPRQALHLVRVGSQLILVGATNESLRALSVIDDADLAARLAGQELQQAEDSHAAEFERCLAGESRAYGGDPAEPTCAGVFPTDRLSALRRKLADTARRLQNAVAQT
jgi:flagellar biogenesis protein FliO